jgi:hypothetical protein
LRSLGLGVATPKNFITQNGPGRLKPLLKQGLPKSFHTPYRRFDPINIRPQVAPTGGLAHHRSSNRGAVAGACSTSLNGLLAERYGARKAYRWLSCSRFDEVND